MKKQHNNQNILLQITGIIMILSFTACEKFIEVDPPNTEITKETVFTTDASAMSAARGIYSLMMSAQSFTNGGLEEYTGILSDELISYDVRPDVVQFYNNSLTPTNGDVLAVFWKEAYRYIGNANSMLEGLVNASGMTPDMKKQVEGEGKFIRAFCHFYLVNFFGDVPYLTTSDYRLNSIAPRLPANEVYEKIEADLVSARDLMKDDFSMANNERIQPTKGAATALLSRLYLYRGYWERAEAEASKLIGNTTLYSLNADLNAVFLKNSSETIWQLQPVVPGLNTTQGSLFILNSSPNTYSKRVSMKPELHDAFEPNDKRLTKWVGSYTEVGSTWYYPYKYKIVGGTPVVEYEMMFRLAEQYLIRSEARANLGNINGAQQDLNMIRTRAGLPNTTASDKNALLTAVGLERRIELFAECGHRWLDLKRTNRADAVLGPIKPDWQPKDVLFPIPESERQLNPNLTQNNGY